MKLNTILLIQALCLSPASAFYIWKPCVEDGSCTHPAHAAVVKDKVEARENIVTLDLVRRAHPRATKGHKRPSSPRVGGFGKRDSNTYEVLEANDPSYAYSVGIDQDGSDLSYFISVGVGSEETPMYMLVDTGAGSTWLMSADCSTDACKLHNTFSASESKTFVEEDQNFRISYGSGSVNGSTVTDSLNVAGLKVGMTFGLANCTSDDFESFPFDGILGLSLNAGSTDSFTKKLTEASEIRNKIFSVFLARASSNVNNGELTLGGINSARYTGDITYTSLASKTNGDWSIPLDGVSFDGSDAGISGRTGYIDTGTSYIFGPPDDVEKLHSMIDGAKTSDNSRWSVPCDTDKTLEFTFGGKSWALQTEDWISVASDGNCYSYIMGIEVVKGGWLMGDAFIKNVYSVFDITNRRIGFAEAKQSTPTSTTASASATSTARGSTTTASKKGSSSAVETSATAEAQQSESTAAADTAAVAQTAGAVLLPLNVFALILPLAVAVLSL
ncbi:hypothetical protein BROUX41_005185 [Berkeleyomyces rouxiae]